MSNIDVHCHFFNIQYAFREILVIGWDMANGRYPYDRKHNQPDLDVLRQKDKWLGLIKYAASLIGSATRSCYKNHKFEIKKYLASDLYAESPKDLFTTPLMMDIYYILDSDEPDAITKKNAQEDPNSVEIRKKFFEFADDTKDEIIKEIKNFLRSNIVKVSYDYTEQEIIEETREVLEEIIDDFPYQNDKIDINSSEPRLSWGFEKHKKDLIRLKKNNNKTVFPFYAVDPRRINIIKEVKKLVGREPEKPFQGIKLYPALGYLPSHPNLIPIYDYCLDHKIPITVHGSPGGLPSYAEKIFVRSVGEEGHWFDNSEHTSPWYFGNPNNWEKVYKIDEKYKKLKINFAHFGEFPHKNTNGKVKSWTNRIIGLMGDENLNIYTDISYCHSNDVIDKISDIIKNPDTSFAKKKIMFGTDYIMIMKDPELGGLQSYFNLFAPLPDDLLGKNAFNFLNI